MPPAFGDGLRRRFASFGPQTKVLVSGETGCWPDPGIAPALPWPHFAQQPHFGDLYYKSNRSDDGGGGGGGGNDGNGGAVAVSVSAAAALATGVLPPFVPFPYPNSGGYVGAAADVRAMLREVMNDVRAGHCAGGGTVGNADDQRWIARHWLRNPAHVSVDVFGEVFVSLHHAGEAPATLAFGPHAPTALAAAERAVARRNGAPAAASSFSSSSAFSETGTPPPAELAPVGWASRGAQLGAGGAGLGEGAWDPALWWGGGGRSAGRSAGAMDRRTPHAVWVGLRDGGGGGVGGSAVVAPLVVHGNGHGKRLLRLLSCEMGLHCHWRQQELEETKGSDCGGGSKQS